MGDAMQASNKQTIGSLALKLYVAEGLAKRFDAYQKTVCKLGFDAVCFSFVLTDSFNSGSQYPPVFEISEHYPKAFLETYQKGSWFQHDFTIREIYKDDLTPKDWREKEQSSDLNDNEIALIRMAREQYGIKNAISIPTMKNNNGIAGASIISFSDDTHFNVLKKQHFNTLVCCTRLFSDIIMQQAPSEILKTFVYPNLPNISDRENIILHDLACDLPIQKLGMKEGMSESAVSNHLLRLRKKFNVDKTADLKHLLIRLNILEFLDKKTKE